MDKTRVMCLVLMAVLTLMGSTTVIGEVKVAGANGEKPIIVCTTNVLGSIVKQYTGNQTDVVVLTQPGLCPADYDMKPSDIYAVSKAEALFYHGIKGESWLDGLIEASGNTNITKIEIPGPWNTPTGAKNYIRWIGGNLSQILSTDFNETMNSMLAEIDNACNDILNEAESLNVASFKVICMKWQSQFVSWVGFNVVAEYGPPLWLTTADVQNLTDTAKREQVALVIDNLQSGTDVGATLADECNGVHVVLSNFPDAVPGTDTLAQMFRYNAKQLFDGVKIWKNTKDLRSEVSSLQTQLTIFECISIVMLVAVVVEAVLLYRRR